MAYAVFFDLDGTLTDYGRMVEHTMATLAERVAARAKVDAARFKVVYNAVQAEDETSQRAGGLTVTELRDRRRRFGRTLECLGIHDAALVEELSAAYAEARRTTCFSLPGAEATLRLLKDRGVWVAIVTEGSGQEQRGQIDRLGWTSLLDDLVISEELGLHKPEPALVAAALTRARLEAQQAVFVGDRALWDLQPAKRLGMTTVLFVTSLYREEAEAGAAFIDARVESHDELQEWLTHWLEPATSTDSRRSRHQP